MPFRLRLLGQAAIEGPRGPVPGPAAQRRRVALLAVLAAAGGRAVTRDRLVALLWPESDAERARASLSSAVYALRAALGAAAVVGHGDDLALDPRAVGSDVGEFERAADAGDHDAAAALYGGPFLDGVHVPEADEFERWVDVERDRLARRHARVLEAMAAARAAAGDHAAAVECWRRLAAADPLSARVALGLVGALDAAGDRASALRHAGTHAELLRHELGAAPDPRVAALAERLRRAPDPAAPALPSLPASCALPAPPDALVGRERELAAAVALLGSRDVRLLTLTGPGGTGKTRLAVALADAFRAAGGGTVAFVSLADVRDPTVVPAALARALAPRDAGGAPGAPGDPDAWHGPVVRALGGRDTLLVLDNFEQVAAAAPAVARLLGACAGLRVLVTSRVRLHVRGEHEFAVPPLALPGPGAPGGPAPDVAALGGAPAVALFLARAAAARAHAPLGDEDVRAAAAVCARLDGLPLAIELAAARSGLLTPRAMLARLERRLDFLVGGPRDLPHRQQTLRHTLAWSHDLLGPAEQLLFRRLAVFAGGAPLAALGAVCLPDVAEGEVVGLAGSLVAQSLARRHDDADGEPRLLMLETVREFALEQVEAAGEAEATRDRHRAYFAALAESVAPRLVGPNQARALARLDAERENLRAALDRTEAGGDAAATARLTLALWRQWLVRGHFAEGRERLGRALAVAPAVPPAVRADLLSAEAALAQNQGRYDAAAAAYEEALALRHALGDRVGEARARSALGWMAWRRCRYAEARALAARSLADYRALDDRAGAAQASNVLGWAAFSEGGYQEATARFGECLALREQLGDARDVAFAQAALAWAAGLGGDARRASALLEAAEAGFRAIGERQLTAFARRVAAEFALARGESRAAARILEQDSIPTFREIGDHWGLTGAVGLLGDALLAAGREAEAARSYEESLGLAHAAGDRAQLAAGHARLAVLARVRGDAGGAEAHAAHARGLLAEIGGALPPLLRAAFDRAAAGAT